MRFEYARERSSKLLAGPDERQRDEDEEHAGHRLDRDRRTSKDPRAATRRRRTRAAAIPHCRPARRSRFAAVPTRSDTRRRAPRAGARASRRGSSSAALAARQPTEIPRNAASSMTFVKNVRNSTWAGNQRMHASSRKSTRTLAMKRSMRSRMGDVVCFRRSPGSRLDGDTRILADTGILLDPGENAPAHACAARDRKVRSRASAGLFYLIPTASIAHMPRP